MNYGFYIRKGKDVKENRCQLRLFFFDRKKGLRMNFNVPMYGYSDAWDVRTQRFNSNTPYRTKYNAILDRWSNEIEYVLWKNSKAENPRTLRQMRYDIRRRMGI